MLDYLSFRRMITPVLIHLLFWIGFGGSIIYGSVLLIDGFNGIDGLNGSDKALQGFLVIIGGPLITRVVCEILILFFRINETLTEIAHSTKLS